MSDEVLDEHFDPEFPPGRDDGDMPRHLARQLGWKSGPRSVGETMRYLAAQLNELFHGFPIDSDGVASTLAETALKGTSASELVELVLAGPPNLRSAALPPEAGRYDKLAAHTRPLVQTALRSQLRSMFERWNHLDHAEVTNRLRPSYRTSIPAPVAPLSRSERRKDREGMGFKPPYR